MKQPDAYTSDMLAQAIRDNADEIANERGLTPMDEAEIDRVVNRWIEQEIAIYEAEQNGKTP